MRCLALVALAACAPPPPPAPLASHVPAATPTQLAPVLAAHVDEPACPLAWNELDEASPPRIPLAGPTDDCPPGFDPKAMCTAGDECVRGTMRGGTRVALAIHGPEGTGHFFWLGLAVEGGRSTCMMASTVGWRLLAPVFDSLAPLPWLTDLDHDGSAELVVWTRLPWGDAEVTNALFPVVYVLDGDALVRRDDLGTALRAKVAAAYRKLAAHPQDWDPVPCLNAVAHALDHQ